MVDSAHRRHIRWRVVVGFALVLAFFASDVRAADDARGDGPAIVTAANVETKAEVGEPEIATIVQHLDLPRGATDVAWSPDGKLLATVGGLRQQIMMWEPLSGKLLWERSGNFGGEQALVFSNDGKSLLVSGAGSSTETEDVALTIWDVASGTVVGHVAGPFPGEGAMANSARAIAVDRQHELLAIVAAQEPGWPVAIYDMRTWKLTAMPVVKKDMPQTLAFAGDGTLAVGTVGGRIALFDAPTRHLKRTIVIHSFVQSLAFSPDAKFVAAGDVAIRIWNTTDGKLARSYAGRLSDLKSLAWSPDGRYLATASFDNVVRLWPAGASRQPLARFKFEARCVAFRPDGAFLAAAGNGGAIILQLR